MLNRVAAFVEKAGLPHDRVLTDAELDAAIRASGETPATYYYGHDYRAADLIRFFALADRAGVALTPEEERLRRLLRQAGWTDTSAAGALISIPKAGADPLGGPRSPRRHSAPRTGARRILHQPYLRRLRRRLLARWDAGRGPRSVPPLPHCRRLRSRGRRPDDERDAGLPHAHARPALLQPGHVRDRSRAACLAAGRVPAEHASGMAT